MPIFGTASSVTLPRRQDGDSVDLLDFNLRLVAAFFLGWVFIYSIQCMLCSVVTWSIAQRIWALLRFIGRRLQQSIGISPLGLPVHRSASQTNAPVRMDSDVSSINRSHDRTSLIFTLNLCFVFASIAFFLSLLSFKGGVRWETGCTFVVAWGGMASRSARLIGILILCLELRRNRIRRWERWGIWAIFCIALGAIAAVENANALKCNRKRFLPVALTSSFVQLGIELYVAIRLMTIILPSARGLQNIIGSPSTVHLGRALSLVVFELLTFVPDAIDTSVVAEFVPFTVGSIIVLAAFNRPSRSIRTAPPSPIMVFNEKSPYGPQASPHDSPPSFVIISPLPSTGPETHDKGYRQSVQTVATSALSSVEDAVVYTAVRHAFSQGSIILPGNTPGGVEDTQGQPSQRRRILSFQTEVAEELERMAEEAQQQLATGPIPRRSKPRPNMTIVVHDPREELDGAITASLRTDGSTVLGSDIIRGGSSRLNRGMKQSASPSLSAFFSPQESDALTEHTDHRHSYASTQCVSEYDPDDGRFSIISRTSRGKNSGPVRHSFLKSSWSTPQRLSLASRSGETLSTLAEGRPSGSFRSSIRSKKSQRRSEKSVAPPMPQLPLRVATDMPPIPSITLTPSLRTPAPPQTPSIPYALPPSTPEASLSVFNGPQADPESLTHKIKGPRPPPSVFFP
ncbi:unnamed protein product [Somion occarium]|uniref:Pheromone receptor n=1 Tax=Somion occarium TaxID=3059160 RepID=A0ABP1CYH4_9APHY